MRADAECLILEDDPEKLTDLKNAALQAGMYPLVARSPSKALSLLRQCAETNRPVLAIVDKDMGMAPDQSRTSIDVLRVLFSEFKECLVIVYSANINTPEAREEVMRAHPRAHVHDKRGSDTDLFNRINRMISPTIGDLTIEQGAVHHVPTKDQHHHRVAVSLLMNYPSAITLPTETMTRAARRFDNWLQEHESPVSVAALGGRKYRLQVKE